MPRVTHRERAGSAGAGEHSLYDPSYPRRVRAPQAQPLENQAVTSSRPRPRPAHRALTGQRLCHWTNEGARERNGAPDTLTGTEARGRALGTARLLVVRMAGPSSPRGACTEEPRFS